MSDKTNLPTQKEKRNLIVLAEMVILDVGKDPEPILAFLEAEFLDIYSGGFAVIGYQVEEQVNRPSQTDSEQQFVTKDAVLEISEEYLLSWIDDAKPKEQTATKPPEQEDLHKPFPIASVCRVDLQDILTDEEIAGLSDADMQEIADKMGDAYAEDGEYWGSLEIIAKSVMKQKTEAVYNDKEVSSNGKL